MPHWASQRAASTPLTAPRNMWHAFHAHFKVVSERTGIEIPVSQFSSMGMAEITMFFITITMGMAEITMFFITITMFFKINQCLHFTSFWPCPSTARCSPPPSMPSIVVRLVLSHCRWFPLLSSFFFFFCIPCDDHAKSSGRWLLRSPLSAVVRQLVPGAWCPLQCLLSSSKSKLSPLLSSKSTISPTRLTF